MATLTLQKVDFRAKNIPRNKKGHNDKGVILQENVIILKFIQLTKELLNT